MHILENAFGRFVTKLRCLHYVMPQEVEFLQLIVHACAILLNIISDRYPCIHNQNMINSEDANHKLIHGDWR